MCSLLQGRRGHGSIYVFGAGNGGFSKDSCSFNGLINSIYTIGITGVNKDGSVPRYGERCPGIMAVTYSKDIFTRADKVVSISTSRSHLHLNEIAEMSHGELFHKVKNIYSK